MEKKKDPKQNSLKVLHCWVSGRVQGVYFRQNTQRQAKSLGLVGWVRNVSDGRVEVLIGGSKNDKLQEMQEWLKKGPPLARVDHLEVEESKERILKMDFLIR